MSDKRVVEAEEFILRDGDGNVRAHLGCEGRKVRLDLCDRDGTGRVSAGVNGDSSFLSVADPRGTPRIMLGSYEPGIDAGITLADQDGEPIASLTMSDAGSCTLWFYGPGETIRASLGSHRNGSFALTMFDARDNARLAVSIDPSGRASVKIGDERGNAIWRTPELT